MKCVVLIKKRMQNRIFTLRLLGSTVNTYFWHTDFNMFTMHFIITSKLILITQWGVALHRLYITLYLPHRCVVLCCVISAVLQLCYVAPWVWEKYYFNLPVYFYMDRLTRNNYIVQGYTFCKRNHHGEKSTGVVFC